jgi:hypothetical protein
MPMRARSPHERSDMREVKRNSNVPAVASPIRATLAHVAELHWYEAAGIGRKEFKIKQLL